MTDQERAVLVQLVDDLRARGVRHFRKGDVEVVFDRPESKPAAKVPPLSRIRAEAV